MPRVWKALEYRGSLFDHFSEAAALGIHTGFQVARDECDFIFNPGFPGTTSGQSHLLLSQYLVRSYVEAPCARAAPALC